MIIDCLSSGTLDFQYRPFFSLVCVIARFNAPGSVQVLR